MMRSFVHRPDSCLSALLLFIIIKFLYTSNSRATLFFFPSRSLLSLSFSPSCYRLLRWRSSFSLSLSPSFSSFQCRKEIKIVCIYTCRRRHRSIVVEGGRHVVLYAFSHHSFFLYVDLFFLVLQREKKIHVHTFIKSLTFSNGTRMNGTRRLVLLNLIFIMYTKSGNVLTSFFFVLCSLCISCIL